ncbi:sensor protein cssS [Desulfocucumis palustris]|uniref:histidine kinase n=1 Tax=Desulfocucumis palustris TaxID=1898651 RepID=A0A2L2XHU8_9FIRM|nr:sensor histidine kinase [Desulfocucumis palustris]GBF35702.1 sensor protein cssS [Desulfocucumis palustris]
MKNLPLSVQIWLVFGGLMLFVFGLLAVFLPWTLKGFFTSQIYDLLNDSQSRVKIVRFAELPPLTAGGAVTKSMEAKPVTAPGESIAMVKSQKLSFKGEAPGEDFLLGISAVPAGGDMPVVSHMVLTGEFPGPETGLLPRGFMQAVEKDATAQKGDIARYSMEIGDRSLFYVIRKEDIQGQPGYLVSYTWGNYRNDMVLTMFWRLLLLMVILFLFSWLPSLWLSRYLSRPLEQMERQVSLIAERQWHQPFLLDRRDEIGRLAGAFENMRRRLVRQDKARQSNLQNISHELKTPVMVIRSYAQSILDGIYPRGTLDSSVSVINSEAERLEKRIQDLLYLNKLNYLKSRDTRDEAGLQHDIFDLAEMVGEGVERFRWQKPELQWLTDLTPALITGNREQWGVVVENLLDNQLRYARQVLKISLETRKKEQRSVLLKVWNDGPPIDPALSATLFQQYKTGEDGKFGLGLAIIKEIAELHGAKVWVENEERGVAFYIEIPVS